ncbi:MAG: hypothetical protein WAX77_11630 [Methylococcaceae bacterium]
MNATQLLNDIEQLPLEAQLQLEEFIASLKSRYLKTQLADEEFVGLWKNREDMQDSSAWLKTVRENQWTRKHD